MSVLLAPVIWAATALVAATTVAWLAYRAVRAVSEGYSVIDFLTKLPRVNFLAVIGAGLAIVVTLTLLAGAVINAGTVFRVTFDYELIDKIIWLVLAILGFDVLGFLGKRFTFKTGAPDDTVPKRPRKRPARSRKRPPAVVSGNTPPLSEL